VADQDHVAGVLPAGEEELLAVGRPSVRKELKVGELGDLLRGAPVERLAPKVADTIQLLDVGQGVARRRPAKRIAIRPGNGLHRRLAALRGEDDQVTAKQSPLLDELTESDSLAIRRDIRIADELIGDLHGTAAIDEDPPDLLGEQ